MKLGIIVGHHRGGKGAFSPFLNASEYDWNTDLSERIMNVASGLDRRVFFRDGVGISGAYRNSDDWGSNITVELHFNSSDNEDATGTAMLYYPGSAKGRSLATHMQSEINGVLGLGPWPSSTDGVLTPFQASGKAQNGLTNLGAGRAPATLLEPFFGSNETDCATAAARKDDYAAAIIVAAEKALA